MWLAHCKRQEAQAVEEWLASDPLNAAAAYAWVEVRRAMTEWAEEQAQ